MPRHTAQPPRGESHITCRYGRIVVQDFTGINSSCTATKQSSIYRKRRQQPVPAVRHDYERLPPNGLRSPHVDGPPSRGSAGRRRWACPVCRPPRRTILTGHAKHASWPSMALNLRQTERGVGAACAGVARSNLLGRVGQRSTRPNCARPGHLSLGQILPSKFFRIVIRRLPRFGVNDDRKATCLPRHDAGFGRLSPVSASARGECVTVFRQRISEG